MRMRTFSGSKKSSPTNRRSDDLPTACQSHRQKISIGKPKMQLWIPEADDPKLWFCLTSFDLLSFSGLRCLPQLEHVQFASAINHSVFWQFSLMLAIDNLYSPTDAYRLGECKYFKRYAFGDNEIFPGNFIFWKRYEKSAIETLNRSQSKPRKNGNLDRILRLYTKVKVLVKKVSSEPKMAIEEILMYGGKARVESFGKTKTLVWRLRFVLKKLFQWGKFSLLLFVATV